MQTNSDINKKPDSRKFAFIVCSNNSQYLDECTYYISHLDVPQGYSIDFVAITDAVSMTAGYNEAMQACNAKYKIYLHQDVFCIDPSLLYLLLDIFKDQTIGMFGVFGGSFRTNADIHHYWNKGTTLNATYREVLLFDHFDASKNSDYVIADGPDGMFIATQYDLSWDERITGWHMYDIAQAIRFHNAGLKTAVLNSDKYLTLHDSGLCSEKNYNEARRQICSLYPEVFNYEDLHRELNTDESDEKHIREIIDEILKKEYDSYGYSMLPEDIPADAFYYLYSEVKFLIRRMELGMPHEDWCRLTEMIRSGEISSAFLIAALERAAIDPEHAAELIEHSLTGKECDQHYALE